MAESIQTIPTGGMWLRKGRHAQRAIRTTVTIKNVDFDVEYVTDGYYVAATETDPAEYPTATVMGAQIGGIDVWHLFRDTAIGEDITEAVERELRS